MQKHSKCWDKEQRLFNKVFGKAITLMHSGKVQMAEMLFLYEERWNWKIKNLKEKEKLMHYFSRNHFYCYKIMGIYVRMIITVLTKRNHLPCTYMDSYDIPV